MTIYDLIKNYFGAYSESCRDGIEKQLRQMILSAIPKRSTKRGSMKSLKAIGWDDCVDEVHENLNKLFGK